MLRRQLLDGLLTATAALAAWALAAPGLETARADAAQVTVIAPGGSQQALSLDALAGGEDVVDRAYLLRSGSGESSETVSGFSLAALIDAAGADPFAFSYLEVLRPAGGAVQLSRHQALDPGAFADGPPVVYATASGTAFLRPSGGVDDVNASDSFEAPQGVTIALRKGSPLAVEAEASTLKTRPGKAVDFSAAVEGAGAGESLTYSWYFDDGASAAGPEATHAFAKRGSYDVVVGITTPGDSTGASAVVTVQVGPPLEGPDRKGGGKRRDRQAPDHGAATGASGATGGPPTSETAAADQPSESTQPPDRAESTERAEPRPAGIEVSGRLLNTIAAPTPETRPQAGARTGRLDDEENGGPGLSSAALGLVVTAGLLGAGALTEARSLLR